MAREKNDERVIDATDLGAAALGLLLERVDEDWYDEEPDHTLASRILAAGDGARAWRFLERRSDAGYEYESVRIAEIEAP